MSEQEVREPAESGGVSSEGESEEEDELEAPRRV